MAQSVDFIIVGQGLAGSLLAWTLLQRRASVMVIDNGKPNASQVAAGLVNPVTGKRLYKTRNVFQFLVTAKQLYRQLSQYFDQDFFIDCPMSRIIRDRQELEYCHARLEDPEYLDFLDSFIRPAEQASILNAPFGILMQKQTGYLLTRQLLQYLHDFFNEKQLYLQEEVVYQDIKINRYSVRLGTVSAQKILFCEGHLCKNNPWFGDLPWQPVKGEILTLDSHHVLPDSILNYGHWLIPLDSTRCRTGATFDWNNLNLGVSPAGQKTLLDALYSVYPAFKLGSIQEHQAGIRPCTRDKQPFIGLYPDYPRLGVFNGFGAKGSLQIPWYALRFGEFLMQNSPLPPCADVARYHATHFAGA